MSESSIAAGVRAAQEQIAQTLNERRALNIFGGGSRPNIGRNASSQESLRTNELNGVISYEPSELVLRVGAGTPITDVQQLLATNGQYLPFEPHDFGAQGASTVGGLIASGLSGSARPWAGAVRDYILGLGLINGCAEVLNFGGQVMKNVAGYDVSRMMVGSLGSLGLITEASFKVLPLPEKVAFYTKQSTLGEALELAARMSKKMSALSGFAYYQGQAYLRLQGSPAWLESERVAHALTETATSEKFWDTLARHQGGFFQNTESRLWRISLPKFTNLETLLADTPYLVDWMGAQYWVQARPDFIAGIIPHISALGAYVMSFNQDDCYCLPEMNGVSLQLHQRMKQAYDPSAVFNPNRLSDKF